MFAALAVFVKLALTGLVACLAAVFVAPLVGGRPRAMTGSERWSIVALLVVVALAAVVGVWSL